LTVEGLLTYQAGMSGSGGTGAAASIEGNVQITSGDLTADDISLKHHTHPGDSGGTTGGAQ
ncbi:phage baseplate assembly protein V, partial [Klebsiella pneumoniae]|nr:phage baseplate assembly protein V [Klebsiella pneumoniae]